MAKRGVVIVGSGLIARFHAQAVNASEKLELKGFCDLFSLESAKKAAAEFGGLAWGDYKSAFTADNFILFISFVLYYIKDKVTNRSQNKQSHKAKEPQWCLFLFL